VSLVEEKDQGGEAEPRQMSFLAAAAWTIGLFFATTFAVQLTESARAGASLDLVNDTACELLAYSLVVFAMVRIYAPTTPMRAALGVKAVSPLHVLLAAIAGAALAPGMSAVDEIMARRFPLSQEETEALTTLYTATTIRSRVALVFALAVAIPIAEEIFFRGILFGCIRKGRTLGLAIAATTVYSASAQLTPRLFLSTLAVSVVLAWLRGQAGSVLSPIAAHIAFQAVQLVPLARTGDPAAEIAYPRSWMLGGVLVGLLALIGARALASRDERALAASRQ
jgi:membrane protease YdiL (CAAX protease family)